MVDMFPQTHDMAVDVFPQTKGCQSAIKTYFLSSRSIQNVVCYWKMEVIIVNKKTKEQANKVKALTTRFEFRSIHPEEADQAVAIEQICFPPNEACSKKSMKERIARAPELFLVAVDRESGKLAGFLNGLATNEQRFRDEFFTDAALYEPEGSHVMLLGLDVLPEYRGQGLARELVYQYVSRERVKGRRFLVLTCLESKVKMYEKMGFYDHGIANSTWGGEEWHEMSLQI